jgi:transposase-like protein
MAKFRIKCPFCKNSDGIVICQCESTDFRDKSGDSQDDVFLTCNKCEKFKFNSHYTCPNCKKQFNADNKKFIREDSEEGAMGCGGCLILLLLCLIAFLVRCNASH